jgi:carboxymethylenebutenolidase
VNRRIDIKIYDGAGHAFENPTNTAGYRADAAADAWTRTVNFLNRALH